MTEQKAVAIEATRKTPQVLLQSGRIVIKGRAISENPGDFFRPLLEWISIYLKNGTGRTEIELGFEYINTSSIKWIYALLKEIATSKTSAANITITWNYEYGDEDMFDLGLILRSIIACKFIFAGVDRILGQQP